MGFRRQSDKGAWKTWLEANRATLNNCGVPDVVLQSQLRWIRFLEEGADYDASWNVWMLSQDQAEVLRRLMLAEFDAPAHRGTIRELEEVMSRGAS